MDKLLRIGITGCGAIGSSLARAIIDDFSKDAALVGLYDIDMQKCYKLAVRFKNKKLATLNLDELINRVQLVIEATRADSAYEIARRVISSSKDVMIMSVGGIIERYKELGIVAQEKKANIFIPSGAICGVDGLKALSFGKINRITLITKKPPKAFLGSAYILKRKIRLDKIEKDTVIFEGDAFSAIRTLPQNINVAATLSIAGIGPENTNVRIIASPSLTRNIHEVEIESDAGRILTRTENIVHPDNPKTSYLAVLSAIATLKQILAPLKIGT